MGTDPNDAACNGFRLCRWITRQRQCPRTEPLCAYLSGLALPLTLYDSHAFLGDSSEEA